MTRWFEDIVIDEVFQLGSHTFSADEIIRFASLYDPQYFHLDAAAAQHSHFGGLVASGWQGADDLQVLCDARGMSRERVSALSARVAELHTLYGQLETTLYCASATLDDDGRIVVGSPLMGSTLHLLDDELRPVGPGGVGTIHVAGAGVVRGYLGGPSDITDAFIPDPFNPDGRGLLFRTDDRARRCPDGSLMLQDGWS